MNRKQRRLTQGKKKKSDVGSKVLSPRIAEQTFNDALNAFQNDDLAEAALKADHLISSILTTFSFSRLD